LVGSFVMHVYQRINAQYTDVQHLCQISLLAYERSRSKFRVKLAVLKIFSQNTSATVYNMFTKIWQTDWTTRDNSGMEYDLQHNSRWWSGGGLGVLACYKK